MEENIAQPNQTRIIVNDFTREKNVWRVQTDARLTFFDILLDNNEIKTSLEIILEGVGASVEIIGLFFGTGAQNFEIAHIVRHKASHTTSKLVTKGALNDQAKTTYKGLIEIAKGSVGCSGEQSEHTLLLSDQAHIEAVPALEIGNNNVKAAHSVSTTYIDELKKFYLESRGLSEEDAARQIVQGHFSDVLAKIPDESARREIEEKIAKKLK